MLDNSDEESIISLEQEGILPPLSTPLPPSQPLPSSSSSSSSLPIDSPPLSPFLSSLSSSPLYLLNSRSHPYNQTSSSLPSPSSQSSLSWYKTSPSLLILSSSSSSLPSILSLSPNIPSLPPSPPYIGSNSSLLTPSNLCKDFMEYSYDKIFISSNRSKSKEMCIIIDAMRLDR